MDQTLINWILAGVGTGISTAISFILKVVWEGLRELQKADIALTSKISELQLTVAGQYIRREDLDKVVDALFKKLDRMEDKLDGKMDRVPCDHITNNSNHTR